MRITTVVTYSYRIPTTLPLQTIMTRAKWTTDEQEAWLNSHMTAFLAANQTKSAAKVFFPNVVKEFREKWPLPPLTPEEIKDAGNAEFALRVQKSKHDKVSNLNKHCKG